MRPRRRAREQWTRPSVLPRRRRVLSREGCRYYTVLMAIKDGLLVEFDHEIGTTRKLLERVPDDKLAWKPHVKSMSLGGLATHLAHIPFWGSAILNDTFFDLEASPPNVEEKTSRDDILAAFEQATMRTRALLDK